MKSLYHIYYVEDRGFDNPAYFFLYEDYISSDFTFIEQLIDCGLDDPSKVKMPFDTVLEMLTGMSDVTLVAKVENLEDLEDQYPELFI
jgi:hypothetical protein